MTSQTLLVLSNINLQLQYDENKRIFKFDFKLQTCSKFFNIDTVIALTDSKNTIKKRKVLLYIQGFFNSLKDCLFELDLSSC